MTVEAEIGALKRERGALILAHINPVNDRRK